VEITDKSMTRFIMTIEQAVRLVLRAAELSRGGEIYVVPMPKVRLVDLLGAIIDEEARVAGIDPRAIEVVEVGRRPGERLHESLLTAAECERAATRDGLVVVGPPGVERPGEGPPLAVDDFRSETGPFLEREEIAAMLRATGAESDEADAVPPPPDAAVLRHGRLREELLEAQR
jgi:hypothetical protein